MPEQTFAWCFSHGRLHVFRPSTEYPDGAWCTATWVPFAAATEEQAIEAKQVAYGDAAFFDDLPVGKQLEVVKIRET